LSGTRRDATGTRTLRAMALCWAVLAFGPGTGIAEDKVIGVESQDAEMNAAIASARNTLTEFWRAFEHPPDGAKGFALKVRISDKGKTEHFWLTEIQRKGDKISGLISNDPSSVMIVKPGQRYEFTGAEITDWMFLRNGKIVGNLTLRPLLKRMEPEQAEYYRRMLQKP
jgi:uncharacterized protein YegJ (DUF2314 family)